MVAVSLTHPAARQQVAAWTRWMSSELCSGGTLTAPSGACPVAALTDERLDGLVYRLLRNVHDSRAASIEARYRYHLAHNMRRVHRAAMLRDALVDARIRVILLKGAAISLRAGDPGVRPFADVDLLVPAARIGEAVNVLTRMGVTVDDDEHVRTRAVAKTVNMRWQVEGNETLIDLHRGLARPGIAPRLAERMLAYPHSLGGWTVPGAVEAILHVAIHRLSGGGVSPLSEALDVVVLLHGDDAPAAVELAEAARSHGILGAVWELLWWVQHHMPTRRGEEARQALEEAITAEGFGASAGLLVAGEVLHRRAGRWPQVLRGPVLRRTVVPWLGTLSLRKAVRAALSDAPARVLDILQTGKRRGEVVRYRSSDG